MSFDLKKAQAGDIREQFLCFEYYYQQGDQTSLIKSNAMLIFATRYNLNVLLENERNWFYNVISAEDKKKVHMEVSLLLAEYIKLKEIKINILKLNDLMGKIDNQIEKLKPFINDGKLFPNSEILIMENLLDLAKKIGTQNQVDYSWYIFIDKAIRNFLEAPKNRKLSLETKVSLHIAEYQFNMDEYKKSYFEANAIIKDLERVNNMK